MVTRQDIMKLKRQLAKQQQAIRKAKQHIEMEAEVKRLKKKIRGSSDPQKVIKQQRNKRLFKSIRAGAMTTQRGATAFGRGTLKFIDSLPSIDGPKRKPQKRRRKK